MRDLPEINGFCLSSRYALLDMRFEEFACVESTGHTSNNAARPTAAVTIEWMLEIALRFALGFSVGQERYREAAKIAE